MSIEPEIFCAHSKMELVSNLKPNPQNPNRHSHLQIEALAKWIPKIGWRAPIVISKRSGLIVKGHARFEAAKLLNLKQVPIDEQIYKSDQDERADMVGDNSLSGMSVLDLELSRGLLMDMPDLASILDISLDVKLFDKEKELDVTSTETTNTCPSCGYEW